MQSRGGKGHSRREAQLVCAKTQGNNIFYYLCYMWLRIYWGGVQGSCAKGVGEMERKRKEKRLEGRQVLHNSKAKLKGWDSWGRGAI